ncbi:MAG: hypothetical protein R3D80_17080 [Paracoccaceae bacterium]
MKTLLIAAAASVTTFFAAAPVVADVPTINVLVVQEDWDEDSLIRNNRIQTAVLNTLNQTLHAPAYQSVLERYGISGMDVYDETFPDAPVLRTGPPASSRRRADLDRPDDQQPRDGRARALHDLRPCGHRSLHPDRQAADVAQLPGAQHPRRPLDGRGQPRHRHRRRALHRLCDRHQRHPADPHCVKEFVSEYGEQLARNAGNKLAIQLAGSLGRAYGSAPSEGTVVDPAAGETNAAVTGETMAYQAVQGCGNIPTTFNIKWIGFEQRQINAIEEHMNFWKCALDTDLVDSSFAEATFSYKTRADKARVVRNIRLMLELLGQVAEPRTEGANTIVVEALGIREN